MTKGATTGWAGTGAQILGSEDLPGGIVKESLLSPGWDPDEPVPAVAWHKPAARRQPLLIYIDGFGGGKERVAPWCETWAAEGVHVLSVDPFLHGDRLVNGIFRPDIADLGDEYSIWIHQTCISHTARDVSAIVDSLGGHDGIDASRIAVSGTSMGGATALVLAFREPRISTVISFIGSVDGWYDVTKIPPGPEQDAKKATYSARLHQLVNSIDRMAHMERIAPKALLLANGAADHFIDIATVRHFVDKIRPLYADCPERLRLVEDPDVGHQLTETMLQASIEWLHTHLVEGDPT